MGQDILDRLARAGAVITGSHLVYTSGLHGTGYINMRAVAHDSMWLANIVARRIVDEIDGCLADLVLGPETLGRTLAQYVAVTYERPSIWCDIVGAGDDKHASFSPKLNFERLVEGKRVVIVDDLLTTGSSIKMVAELVVASGGVPIIGAAVVRRDPNVTAADCGVPELRVLADVPGFSTFTPEECMSHGPCSQCIPMMLRPGHGHEWIMDHQGYPTI